jgi:hypothetical protein
MIEKRLMNRPPKTPETFKNMMRTLLEQMYGPYLINYPDTQGRLYLLYWLYQ